MPTEYRHNHYVPVWYQKRFLVPGQRTNELFYLDLRPDFLVDVRGVAFRRRALRRLGPKHCFAEQDLYTARLGAIESTDIEKLFFGTIDRNGREAVEYFTNFAHPSVSDTAFQNMMTYMSTQKMRTPKGLGWLSDQLKTRDQQYALATMIQLRNLHSALWTECVWQIADATNSATKFILSDHPVTVYNRACEPHSKYCQGFDDPNIALAATHTIFPLSIDRALILTNLSWVRNPYQKETRPRPNPNPLRSAIFKFTEIQTLRHLTEQEVLEINLIIKQRALRYVAAAEREWLYPETHVAPTDWATFGHGYLLMPDPRPLSGGGTIMWGGGPGLGGAMDAYGRMPWDPDFEKEDRSGDEFKTLQTFKGEFAHLFGPYRRGRTFEMTRLDNERDSDEYHQHHLSLYEPNSE